MREAVDIVENTTKQACEQRLATDQSINARLDLTDTYCPNLQFINRAKLTSQCNMDQVADALAKASTKLNKEQTAGLGLNLNVDSSVDKRRNEIKNFLESRCGNEGLVKQSLALDIKGKNLRCDQLQAINDADITTQCIANSVMRTLSTNEFEQASKQKTDILGGLTAFLTAPIWIMGGIILAIGLLFLVFRLFRGRAKGADAAGTQALLPSEQAEVDAAVAKVAQRAAGSTAGEKAEAFSKVVESVGPIATSAISALSRKNKK